MGHSRPASVALTFVFFLCRYCYCFVRMKPFKPRRVCGIALVRGIRFQSLFPTGVSWLFVSGGVTGYQVRVQSGRSCLPLVNLMDCSCLCSEVEMKCEQRKINELNKNKMTHIPYLFWRPLTRRLLGLTSRIPSSLKVERDSTRWLLYCRPETQISFQCIC